MFLCLLLIDLHIVLFLFVFVYPNSVCTCKILYLHIVISLFMGSFKNETLINGEGLVEYVWLEFRMHPIWIVTMHILLSLLYLTQFYITWQLIQHYTVSIV